MRLRILFQNTTDLSLRSRNKPGQLDNLYRTLSGGLLGCLLLEASEIQRGEAPFHDGAQSKPLGEFDIIKVLAGSRPRRRRASGCCFHRR